MRLPQFILRHPFKWLALCVVIMICVWGYIGTTQVIQGAWFKQNLEKETSHGLHIHSTFGPLTRWGLFGVQTDTFFGDGGTHAIQSLSAQKVSAQLNLTGFLDGVWEIDNVQAEQGEVRLQRLPPMSAPPILIALPDPATTNSPPVPATTLPTDSAPNPDVIPVAPVVLSTPVVPGAPTPVIESAPADTAPENAPPWYLAWLPHRVRLQHVLVQEGNVLFTAQGADAGLYGMEVVITPNDRDYEYDAHSGELRVPYAPVLHVNHLHALIQKPRITCSELLFDEGPNTPDHLLRIEGSAGLQAEDRSLNAKIDWALLDLTRWLPKNLPVTVTGLTGGHVEYSSVDLSWPNAVAKGQVHVDNGTVGGINFLKQYSEWTGAPDPATLPLSAHCDFTLQNGLLTCNNFVMECTGAFRLEGTITMDFQHNLKGQVQLGLTEDYLHWFSSGGRKRIFRDNREGYSFADVEISGTLEHPKEDLSNRVVEEVKRNPLLAFKLFFHKAMQ